MTHRPWPNVIGWFILCPASGGRKHAKHHIHDEEGIENSSPLALSHYKFVNRYVFFGIDSLMKVVLCTASPF